MPSGTKNSTIKQQTGNPPSGGIILRGKNMAVIDKKRLASRGFVIEKRIGAGGMGEVFRAKQTSVGRDVAVKMLKDEFISDRKVKESFISEANVTGKLEHPNIIPIHDLGETDDGAVFYAMKEVKGVAWNKVMRQYSETKNLEILLRVCDAVAYSHDKGVIHRDLKPGNVMIGEYGEVFVMDWGIAASVGDGIQAEKLDNESDIQGTPEYMAPEMVFGDPDKIGQRSDIYLLGGILYNIATGQKPRQASSPHECLRMAAANIIQPTDKNGELIDIAMMAMAAEPENRHRTVQDFQQAVRAYLSHSQSARLADQADMDTAKALATGEYHHYAEALFGYREAVKLWTGNRRGIEGMSRVKLKYAEAAKLKGDYDLALSLLDSEDRSHTALSRQIRQAKSRRQARRILIKALSISSAGMTLLVIITLTGAAFWIQKERVLAERARDVAIAAERKANQALAQKERENYYNVINLAKNRILDSKLGLAREMLTATPPDLRGWEWGLLMLLCDPVKKIISSHENSINSLRLLNGGKLMISSSNRKVIIRDLWQDNELFSFDRFAGSITAADASPTETKMVVAGGDGCVIIDYSDTDKQKFLSGHTGEIKCVAFANDGKHFATGCSDGVIIVWTTRTGKVYRRIEGHNGPVNCVAFSNNGRQLVSGGDDAAVRVWTLGSAKLRYELRGHSAPVRCAAFSPDDHLIGSGGDDHTVRLWNKKKAESIHILNRHVGGIESIAFSPDGQRIASGGDDGGIRIWDCRSGKNLKAMRDGKQRQFSRLAFAADGKSLLSADQEGDIVIWDALNAICGDMAGGARGNIKLSAPCRRKMDFKWNADDKGGVVILDNNGKPIAQLKGHAKRVTDLAVSPDMNRVVTISEDNTLRIWDLNNYREILVIEPAIATGRLRQVSFSGDSKNIIVNDGGEDERFWTALSKEAEYATMGG